jgi:hypothetical protein
MSEIKLTVRQLREMLLYLTDQHLTVQEIRQQLAQIYNQDLKIELEPTMWEKLGIE